MIQVVRIAGESLDLETGNELPKSLVLSNGLREISITVPNDIVQEVIRMRVELDQYLAQKQVAAPEAPQPEAGLDMGPPNPLGATAIEEAKRQIHQRIQQATQQPSAPAQPPPLAVVEGEDDEEAGLVDPDDPGREYDDKTTGTVSL